MHDPLSVAFEIRSPFRGKPSPMWPKGYRRSLITIWHNDPETDGTDDSCGWFLRDRHVPKELRQLVQREFIYNFKNNYWFNSDGIAIFSTQGIVLEMFTAASWQVFMYQNGGKPDRKSHRRFLNKYLYEILHFAENPVDSLHRAITSEMYYRTVEHDRSMVESRDERIANFAGIVLCDVMRKIQPWYKHPRWHVQHWEIQFHPWQQLKRRYWDKCCVCGKRGFKSSAIGDWHGTKIWHQECDINHQKPPISEKPQ